MDAVASHACCSPDQDGSDAPAIEAPDCCEVRQVGPLPSAAGAGSIEVAASPLTALLPPLAVVTMPPRAAPPVLAAVLDARHRGPPSPGAARARTMVFLI
jgi:hypothetical protein